MALCEIKYYSQREYLVKLTGKDESAVHKNTNTNAGQTKVSPNEISTNHNFEVQNPEWT